MSAVMVTGANRGIGLEFVRQYLAAGQQVIACCRAPEQAGDLQVLACDALTIVPLDVADEEAITDLPGRLAGREVSLFINNAGTYGQAQSLESTAPADWIDVFRVNTIAPLLLARSLLPLMRGEPGKLVFLSSKMGSIADNSSGATYIYRSTKSALNAVVKSLSVDLAGRGLAVAALHPGWVRTDMGGPNGLIDTRESVQGMRQVIAGLDLASSGKFLNYDGQDLPW